MKAHPNYCDNIHGAFKDHLDIIFGEFRPMQKIQIINKPSGETEDGDQEEHEPDNWEVDRDGFLILPAVDVKWVIDKKRRLIREFIKNRYSMSMRSET